MAAPKKSKPWNPRALIEARKKKLKGGKK